MSYIRSGSNPEKLYIYSSGETVHICYKPGEPSTDVPDDQWEALLKHAREASYKDELSGGDHPDLKTKEVWEAEDGRILEEWPNSHKNFLSKNWVNCDSKIALYYKNELVCTMWRVTWFYICH